MTTYRFLVANGPNLGFLGQRQPEIYGHEGMQHLPDMVKRLLGSKAEHVNLEFFQGNGEGEIIDRLEQAWRDKLDGIAFNAGAYTHTSLAIADCLAWIKIPCAEVHLSNIWARPEPIRHQSFMGAQVIGVIAGFGLLSYGLAVQALYEHVKKHEQPIAV